MPPKIVFYAVLVLASLSGCGQVCIGPFGPADQCYVATTSASGPATSTTGLVIVVTPTIYQSGQVPQGTVLTLAAQNGAATYTWSLIPVTGEQGAITGTAGTNPGTYTGGTVTYTAPSAVGISKVQLLDSTGRTYTLTFDTP
jgi:hypothetical protein